MKSWDFFMAGNLRSLVFCANLLFSKCELLFFYEQRERMTSVTKSETNDGERLACLFWA